LRERIRNHALGLFSPSVLLVTEGIQESPGTGQVQVPEDGNNCTSKGFDRYSSAVRQCISGITGPDHGVLPNARNTREDERYRSGTGGVYLKAPFEGLRRVGRSNPSIVSPPTICRCDGPYAMNGCYRARGNISIESWQSTGAEGTTRALCFQRIP
jgi:hypothetical protein